MPWDAPSETPKDYHVSWAKDGDGFKTWTDLSGNALPTSSAYTITGLEASERYIARLRAGYSQDGVGICDPGRDEV